MRKTAIIGSAVLLALALSACGKSKTPETNQGGTAGGGTATTADAQAIVKQNCTSCHGVNLEGGGGPKLSAIGSKYSKDQIAGIITNGKGAMPNFKSKLSESDISAVSDWLAAKK
ncbi:c-type cytochrome [Paenibacillus ginsengarvi]|uniref:Cytochrome c n=1 Tax=Paenibacillus ginsengarvi TaxID=400777 RepID=A0A3B0BDG6_9BACL|nr:cytochrome c [Paenibacillus ginsengarvi]RKN70127.1 cytochrome c [Paenibacillus ginsengarvi]